MQNIIHKLRKSFMLAMLVGVFLQPFVSKDAVAALTNLTCDDGSTIYQLPNAAGNCANGSTPVYCKRDTNGSIVNNCPAPANQPPAGDPYKGCTYYKDASSCNTGVQNDGISSCRWNANMNAPPKCPTISRRHLSLWRAGCCFISADGRLLRYS